MSVYTPSDFHIFSLEHGFLGLFPMSDTRFRLIARNPLSTPSEDTVPSLQELQSIYDQRSHIPVRFHDLTWSSWFRINSRMIEHLKLGRVFRRGEQSVSELAIVADGYYRAQRH